MADNSWFWAVFQHIFPLIIIKILRNNFVFLLHGFILSPSWDIIVCVFVTHSWRCPEHLGSGREKHQILSELIFRWSYLSGIYQAARAPEDWYPFWSNAEVSKKIGQEVQKVRCILARALNIEFLSPAEECGLGWGPTRLPWQLPTMRVSPAHSLGMCFPRLSAAQSCCAFHWCFCSRDDDFRVGFGTGSPLWGRA